MKTKLMFVLLLCGVLTACDKHETQEPPKAPEQQKQSEQDQQTKQWLDNHKGYTAKPGKGLF